MEPSKHAHRHYRFLTRVKHALLWPFKLVARYARRGFWQRLTVFAAATLILIVGSLYGIGQWYVQSVKDKPLVLGVSFIPAYAESLGLDARQTMDALINDVGVRHFRLVSYWDQMEPKPKQYDFNLLDWQFKKAEAAGATVTLSIGLRQPRWPECHIPKWARALPSGSEAGTWQSALSDYIGQVVQRYKHSTALISYQLENEYLLKGFGRCADYVGEQAAFDRSRLADEFNLVKQLDASRPVILSRSNNLPSWMLGEPRPDVVGMSVYRRVWDGNVTRRYFTYPMPAWYYASLAGIQKLLTGQDTMIHELQAEAWPPHRKNIDEISLKEQNKSFDAKRFADEIKFGKDTGVREMYLWGAEYWYYRQVKLHDSSVWNVAKDEFSKLN